MDFSLRSVRRPTVLSIPTAPFSFSTPLSSSVRSVDSPLRAYRVPTVAGLAAPVFLLCTGLPVGAYADFLIVDRPIGNEMTLKEIRNYLSSIRLINDGRGNRIWQEVTVRQHNIARRLGFPDLYRELPD